MLRVQLSHGKIKFKHIRLYLNRKVPPAVYILIVVHTNSLLMITDSAVQSFTLPLLRNAILSTDTSTMFDTTKYIH